MIQEKEDKHSYVKDQYCKPHSNWYKRYFPSRIATNFHSWTYEEKQNCSNFSSDMLSTDIHPKFKTAITCEGENVIVKVEKNFRDHLTNDDVISVNFGDTCLQRYIDTCCKDEKLVPNVVHYVRYSKSLLTFYEFVSFISVIRFVKPCSILIHGNKLPTGQYWNFVLALSPNIIHVRRNPPSHIFGTKIFYKAHPGDIMRIEALINYGGIYLDTDSVVVKSFDLLRKYPFTMSLQGRGVLSSAFIMAEKNATFLQKWLDGYKYNYKSEKYVYNAMTVPSRIADEYKELINVVPGKFSRPRSQRGPKIFKTNIKWNGIYGIHMYCKKFTMDIELVKHFNTTAGSICRHVLFGNKELCFND